MRALHVIDIVSPIGGAQTYLRALSEELVAAGHAMAILHGERGGEVPNNVPSSEWSAVDLRRWVTAFDPEVVHVHGSAVPPHLTSMLSGLPRVHAFHEFSFICASGAKYFRDGRVCTRAHGPGCLVAEIVRGCGHRKDPRPFLARYRRIAETLAELRGAASIVVHSQFMRSMALVNHLGEDLVQVAPYFVARSGEPRERVDERTVVFAGRIVREKGLDTLIEALALCSDSWDRLLVAGDGWDRGRCARLVSKRGLATRVEFLGHLGRSDVRKALGEARIVVVPSRWPEPFGIVGIEAAALGRPVVASDVGGIPEWLDDGETGLLVPPGDEQALAVALAGLLADPVRTDAMGHEAWRRVVRFSPESHVRRLLSIYEAAAGSDEAPSRRVRAS